MVMWVFGYGSLIRKVGFNYDEKLVGFIRGYRRVFHQGSTDHRGTPSFPGRIVTLEPATDELCGVAYRIEEEDDKGFAIDVSSFEQMVRIIRASPATMLNIKLIIYYLEVREKQYDVKAYLEFFTDPDSESPAVSGVMVYIASPNKDVNVYYLGPATIEEMARQIVNAEGPSGPNRDYLFHLEVALAEYGCDDSHVKDLADMVRKILSEMKPASYLNGTILLETNSKPAL